MFAFGPSVKWLAIDFRSVSVIFISHTNEYIFCILHIWGNAKIYWVMLFTTCVAGRERWDFAPELTLHL